MLLVLKRVFLWKLNVQNMGRKREELKTRCKNCGAPFEMEIDFPYGEISISR